MEYLVEARDVVKQYGKFRALDGLNLKIPRGQTYGLIGPNGSGKTTFIRLLAGLSRPNAGEVRVYGRPMPDRSVAGRIGYMTQQEALYVDLTARENLSFFASIYGVIGAAQKERIRALLELVDLASWADRPVEVMSGGMRQRLSLAVAMVHGPELLLLDEPTVGVDPELRRTFWDHFRRLNDQGVTLVVSTHHLDEAERCQSIGMIRSGRLIAEGSPQELKNRSGTRNLDCLLYTSDAADE